MLVTKISLRVLAEGVKWYLRRFAKGENKKERAMSKGRIKIGIYGVSILMMGVIAISGALAIIGSSGFPEASQTMIQNMISIPCLVVIPVTLLVGKLMDFMSKKTLAVIGAVLFLVGGVAPVFLNSLPLILVFRGIFGISIGIVQPVSSALVAENFEGPEREKVQGNATAAQMLGVCLMVFLGGWLANSSWRLAFLVHLMAIISLVLIFICLPSVKPGKKTGEKTESVKANLVSGGSGESARISANSSGEKAHLTKSAYMWAFTMFILFIGAQVYSVYLAYIVDEKALGTSVQSGNAMAFFAIGGVICGLLYGKLASRAKAFTLFAGLLGILVSYLVIAYAANMFMIYLGAFLFGFSLSVCMPCIIVGTAGSVSPAASAMAISITMCGQNLAQFLCPYIFNPLAAAVGNGSNNNQVAFLAGAVLIGVMAVAAAFWGRKNKAGE